MSSGQYRRGTSGPETATAAEQVLTAADDLSRHADNCGPNERVSSARSAA